MPNNFFTMHKYLNIVLKNNCKLIFVLCIYSQLYLDLINIQKLHKFSDLK